MNIQYFYAIGKRKTAVASVKIFNGVNSIIINNQTYDDYFKTNEKDGIILKNIIQLATLQDTYCFIIHAKGGGTAAQLEAIYLALAKALCKLKSVNRTIFKREKLLRRDSRIKERRKYGLKKARKASQYSKR